MITGDSLHACRMQGGTAKQIATADDHADLNAQAHQLTHLDCYSIQHLGIDTEVRGAGEGLTTELQQYASVLSFLFGHCFPTFVRLLAA